MLDLNMSDKELLKTILETTELNDIDIVDLVIDVLRHRLNLGETYEL